MVVVVHIYALLVQLRKRCTKKYNVRCPGTTARIPHGHSTDDVRTPGFPGISPVFQAPSKPVPSVGDFPIPAGQMSSMEDRTCKKSRIPVHEMTNTTLSSLNCRIFGQSVPRLYANGCFWKSDRCPDRTGHHENKKKGYFGEVVPGVVDPVFPVYSTRTPLVLSNSDFFLEHSSHRNSGALSSLLS